MERKQDNKSLSHSQPTLKAPTEAENAAFIALFEQFYGSGGPFSRWGSNLSVLREALNPRALAENHDGPNTIAAMKKVRNAEAEAESLAGQVQLDTPAEGDCLFWAVMLGALIRANGTDRFEAVVSRLFGEEPTLVDAKQLREVLLLSYQGHVSDIINFDTEHHFYALMMRFRARVANHIARTSELQSNIEGDFKAYCGQMSRQGTWGGEIEIKAMAALLGMDIIVHRDPGSPMHRMPAVAGKQTAEALHIAHVPATPVSSVRNHYRFYVPEGQVSWSREVSAVEQEARDAYAEYQTWRFLSYPVMNFLGALLQSRLPSQPRDDSFDQQILSLLVTGNMNPLVDSKSISFDSTAGTFMNKYDRGDQGFFESSRGQDAQFPASLRDLLGGLASQVDRRLAPPLRRMDPNSRSHMFRFLTLKDQSALIQTCKSLHKDPGRKVRVNWLLSLVAQGRQDDAEAMIKQDPTLLLERGDVTDGAGRTFRGITALQYAVWALDAHMWTMILPYLDRLSPRGSASEQLRQLEEKGTAHGKHFDFKPLLDAYAAFLRNDSSEESWSRGVGGAQRLLPDHVVQEYTTPDRPFEPTSSFAVAGARRPTPDTGYGVQWWREKQYYGGCLGVKWAAFTSKDLGEWPIGLPAVWGVRKNVGVLNNVIMFKHTTKNVRADRRAAQALCRQRGEELTDLLRRYGVEPSPAAESKSPGRR